jgi:hypothetical protein
VAIRALYNRRQWILGQCTLCGRLNYVEPHGTTAHCRCSVEWTEHTSVPMSARVGWACLAVDTARVPKLTREDAKQWRVKK